MYQTAILTWAAEQTMGAVEIQYFPMAARSESIAQPREGFTGTLALDTVRGHCTLVKALVKECLQDLSLVDQFLTDDCAAADHLPSGGIALQRTGFVETRLNEAFQLLAVASRALAGEIKDRRMLDHQFAAIQEQEATGRHRLLHDALTGLPNRILFLDRLEHGLAQSLRHGRPLAVMFIDLDGFKAVNDSYGHDMGDAVLKAVATRLRDHTRSGDTSSRHGGDEFLYLLSEPGDQQSIGSIAERMIRLVQEPYHLSSYGSAVSITLGASIGISISPKDGVTVDKLIKHADAAMYRAKQQKLGYAFAP